MIKNTLQITKISSTVSDPKAALDMLRGKINSSMMLIAKRFSGFNERKLIEYPLDITGSSGTTTNIIAFGIPYTIFDSKTLDKISWRIKFSLYTGHNPATTSKNLFIAGIRFKRTEACSCVWSTTGYSLARTDHINNFIYIKCNANNAASYVTGDVALVGKPLFVK